MKKKLPIQQLIDKMNDLYGTSYPEHISNGIREGLNLAIKEAESLLPVEKAAIVEAHRYGETFDYLSGEDYLTETYDLP